MQLRSTASAARQSTRTAWWSVSAASKMPRTFAIFRTVSAPSSSTLAVSDSVSANLSIPFCAIAEADPGTYVLALRD